MIKRTNKITALLIAATSIMSMVPAMAADSTRLETKEGTIESAVAFSGGNYIYDGYKTADQENALYYNTGDKDNLLEDVNATSINNYGEKYAKVMDGSDEYLVDLSTGKVVDDSSQDKQDNASSKLKAALKKTDRYGSSISVASDKLTTLDGNKFGEVWYGYALNPTDGTTANNDLNGNLYGYTNDAGKYIDVSNVANVYAYSTAKGKVVKIDTFSNKANDENSDTKLQATLIAAPKFLTQDKDNIYQSVKVKITDTAAVSTSIACPGTFTVNFPTSTDNAAFKASTATATIDWTKIGDSNFTSGASITLGTKTFNYGTGNDYTSLSTLKSAVNTYYTVTAPINNYVYNDGVFTATGIGTTYNTSAFTTGNNSDIVKYTPAVDQQFVVNGVPFTYSTTLTGAQNYKDIATLKTAVNNYFTTNATTGYNYSNGVFTFTGTTVAAQALVGNEITGSVAFNAYNVGGISSNGNTKTVTYIQKISKAQGDVKDDAYLPKSVASYEVSKDYDSSDADNASDAFADATSFQVTNGTLYAINATDTNVEVTTMKLMKDKVKFDSATVPTGFDAANKVDVYMVEKGDNDDTDVDQGIKSYSVDVNGNIWAIHQGKIMEFVMVNSKINLLAIQL